MKLSLPFHIRHLPNIKYFKCALKTPLCWALLLTTAHIHTPSLTFFYPSAGRRSWKLLYSYNVCFFMFFFSTSQVQHVPFFLVWNFVSCLVNKTCVGSVPTCLTMIMLIPVVCHSSLSHSLFLPGLSFSCNHLDQDVIEVKRAINL